MICLCFWRSFLNPKNKIKIIFLFIVIDIETTICSNRTTVPMVMITALKMVVATMMIVALVWLFPQLVL
jgi:hypothetical protein